MDIFGIKKDIVDILRDYLYPRSTIASNWYNNSVDTKYAQSFIPFTKSINSISVYCNTIGAPNDMTVSIYDDSNGSPGSEITAVTFSASDITDDVWDAKACSYSDLTSKNKYWLVFRCTGQSTINYYKIGADSVKVNYQIGEPKSQTNSTWDSDSLDIAFKIDIDDWIYPTYPSDTITNKELPRIGIDLISRRVDDRYCSDSLALGYLEGIMLVYSQYPDELDKIISYGERGLFGKRTEITNIDLLVPTGLTPTERLLEKRYVKSVGFNLRKKLKYIPSSLPTVE